MRESLREYKLHTKQHVRTVFRKWFAKKHLRTPVPLPLFDHLMTSMKNHLLDTEAVQLSEEDEAAVTGVFNRLLGDIKKNVECMERDSKRASNADTNVLQLCLRVRSATEKGYVKDLLYVLVKDGFVVRPSRRPWYVERRRPTFDYSIFACVLLWRHCRGSMSFSAEQETALSRLQRLADFGVRGMAAYHACVESLSLINKAFRDKDDAIYRAASARNTIPDQELRSTYERVLKEMRPGEALEIMTADLAWLDNDAFALMVTDLADRRDAYIGPQPRGSYLGINVLPPVNPYCNFYRSKTMGLRLTKPLPTHQGFLESCVTSLALVSEDTDEGMDSRAPTIAPYNHSSGLDVTVTWSLQDELGLGGKMFWGALWGWPVKAISSDLLLFLGLDEMLMRRGGRETKQSMTFSIPPDSVSPMVGRLSEGELGIDWLQDAALGGAVGTERNQVITYAWVNGLCLVAIGIGPELFPASNVHPKNVQGGVKSHVNLHKRIKGIKMEVKADTKNTEASADLVSIFKRQADKKCLWVYLHELQFIYPMTGLSWAPAKFLEPLAGGFTYRHLQPLQYRMWEQIGSVQHHATTLVIYPWGEGTGAGGGKAAEGTAPPSAVTMRPNFTRKSGIKEVTVIFTVHKSLNSQAFPLQDFNMEPVTRGCQDTRVIEFLEEADQPGRVVEVECIVDPRLVELCWEPSSDAAKDTYFDAPQGALNKDRLLRAMAIKQRDLKVRRILLSDTQEKYRSRFTWTFFGYCRLQQTEAGIVKPTRRGLCVDYDHFGNVTRTYVHESDTSLWAGTTESEREQLQMVELWTAAA